MRPLQPFDPLHCAGGARGVCPGLPAKAPDCGDRAFCRTVLCCLSRQVRRFERALRSCLWRAEARAPSAVGGQRAAGWVPGFGACSITRWVLGYTGPGWQSLSALSRELAL